MILDKLLFEQISAIGTSLINKAGLDGAPKNIDEMGKFLEAAKVAYETEEFDGLLFANILFDFVSSIEVRDRHVTARQFEDIFSALFQTKPSDKTSKKNPSVSSEIAELDRYNSKEDNWRISTDLSGNKREKADISIGNYSISLKTLKGYAYGENSELLPKKIKFGNDEIKNEQNNELNVGSLSYRALLKGILEDDELKNLKDRKGGLGSGSAVRANVLNRVIHLGKVEEFRNRLKLFMNYVYDEDLYIVLKSHYQIKWILIPAQTFIDTIINTYTQDEQEFEKIWYRWENNNLRMNWIPLIDKINKYGLPYKELVFNLGKAVHSAKIEQFKDNISIKIQEEIHKMLDK